MFKRKFRIGGGAYIGPGDVAVDQKRFTFAVLHGIPFECKFPGLGITARVVGVPQRDLPPLASTMLVRCSGGRGRL